MRYIPDLVSDVIVQVPEDKNAYINVRNIGASGRGDLEFTGTVTDIDAEGVVTISNIDDGEGNSIFQYQDVLKNGAGIQLFSYRPPATEETPVLQVASHAAVGVDFSGFSGTNSNLAPLSYYVFGFDPRSGRLPYFRSVVNVGSKVLTPDLWSTEQYVQLNLSRTNSNALPVIYRVWGNTVEFLGIIGSNEIGYSGSGEPYFRDLGLTEIPYWDTDKSLPSFLSDAFSVAGSEVTQVRTVTAKERLKIQSSPFGTQSSYIQCTGLSLGSLIGTGNTVKFTLDDTDFVRQAISLAGTTSVKEVIFPAGVYNISDLYFANAVGTDYSGISIRGVGDGSVLRRLPCTVNNSEYPGILNFTGQSISPRMTGIRIRSMGFDGNRSESFSNVPPITSELGLSFKYSDNVVVSDCTVTDCGGGGIGIYNSNKVSLTTNVINNSGRSYEQIVSPLVVDTCQEVVVQGNIMKFATAGPRVISTDFSTINGNIIRGCGDQGLLLESSSQWNKQGNVSYSENDSIIQSIDTYNNEYSRATIEVRKGYALDPIYMTVTYGNESVSILKNTVVAKIFSLDANRAKTTPEMGRFKVLETKDQLDAGIFSLTLPGETSEGNIPSTSSLTNSFGYVYEVTGTILLGNGSRGFQPVSIKRMASTGFIAIELRNSSDILGFQIYSESSPENDRIIIKDFSNSLPGWDTNTPYPVVGIDTDTNSILLNPNPALTSLNTTETTPFIEGSLFIQRSGYFIADGNLYVHSF